MARERTSVRTQGDPVPAVRPGVYASYCMSRRRQLHSSSTRVLSVAMIVIGFALIARTLAAGGGALATGLVLGILFVLAGAARLYLQLRG
jgi:multisubunit Na+/H+ antiporter MnhB subunit